MSAPTRDEIRAAWHTAAMRLWHQRIIDEHGSQPIERLLRRNGWGFFISEQYRNTRKYAWCGHFQANCGLSVGDHLRDNMCVDYHLDVDAARVCFASTYRIQSPQKWQQAGVLMPTIVHCNNMSDEDVAKHLAPGVVATIASRTYGDARDKYGGHFVCVDAVRAADGVFDTIEGNAHGELPDGNWAEGVVRRRGAQARKLSDVRRIILIDDAQMEGFAKE